MVIDKKIKDDDSTGTLYCSFCGKSQHEVRKIIAGPMVFICDECIELCEDIVWTEGDIGDKSIGIKIKLAPSAGDVEDLLIDTLIQSVSEIYPQYKLSIHGIKTVKDDYKMLNMRLAKNNSESNANNDDSDETLSDMKEKIDELVTKLSVTTKKFLFESEKRRILEKEINSIKSEYLYFLRKNINNMEEADKFILSAVMFMDVVGFSSMNDESKRQVVDVLRGLVISILIEKGAAEVNTWGDAVVCTFSDPNAAIISAGKFIRHLSVEHLDARIGMAWGKVRRKFNLAIDRYDIDGPTVNLAARLEPLAPQGGILVSEEFAGLDISEDVGILKKSPVKLKKGFDDFAAGDILNAYIVEIKRN